MNNKLVRYVSNVFLLTLPVLLWNIAFADRLPKAFSADIFWANIPSAIAIPENVLRMVVLVVLPLCMPLIISKDIQRTGLAVYLTGTLVYFLSWVPLMLWPESAWSTSLIGFLAPAYTPLIWLIGIGLIGDSLFFQIPYRSRIYIIISILFVIAHCSHAALVYSRGL